MGMPGPVDPAMRAEMKVVACQTACTALIGVGLIRIAPAVLQGLGMASE